MKKKIMSCIIILMVFTSCNKLQSGKIVDKKYIPGYWMPQTVVTTDGKNTSVGIVNTYYPDEYVLKVIGKTEKGIILTESHDVDATTYLRVKVGEQITF